MHPRIASLLFIALGSLDVLVLNLLLAPRLARLSAPVIERRGELAAAPAPEMDRAREAARVEVLAASLTTRPAASARREREQAASDVEFAQNGTSIERLSSLRELRRVSQEMVVDDERRLLLRGHSDPLGPPEHNLRLGRRRAEAVERYLVDRGAPADRIDVETVGSAELADPRPTPAAWARDRRVEVLWR